MNIRMNFDTSKARDHLVKLLEDWYWTNNTLTTIDLIAPNKIKVGDIIIQIVCPNYPNQELWTNADKTDKNRSDIYIQCIDIELTGFTTHERLMENGRYERFFSPKSGKDVDETYRVPRDELIPISGLPKAIEYIQKHKIATAPKTIAEVQQKHERTRLISEIQKHFSVKKI